MKSKRRRKRRDAIRQARQPAMNGNPADNRTGKASDFLSHLDELASTGAAVAATLCCRVSGLAQRAQLDDQTAALRRRVEDELGIQVVGVFVEVAPGWQLDERPALEAAIDAARANSPGTVVVAESTDRYLRHRDYNENKEAWPTVVDFVALRNRAQGVSLVTMLPPDAPFKDVRYYQQNRGQVAKGNHGGRKPKPKPKPGYERNYKRNYGIDKLTWMLRLGIVEKKTIARLLGRPRSTVQGWVKQWEKRWNRRWPKP